MSTQDITNMPAEDIVNMSAEDFIDKEYNESFELTKSVVRVLGLKVFYTKEKMNFLGWLRYNLIFILNTIGYIHITLGELQYMFSHLDIEVELIVFMIMCNSFTTVAFVKVLSSYWGKDIIQCVFEDVREMWPKPDCRQSVIDIKNRYLKRLRFTTKIILYVYISFVTFYNLDPLTVIIYNYVTENQCVRQTPYLIWYPFDVTSNRAFLLVYVYEVWAGYVSAMGFIAQDCVYQLMCSHIAMLLEIVQDDLENIIPLEWSLEDLANNETHLKHKLDDIIKRHKKLIEMAANLERVCTFVIALNVMSASIIICLMGLLATIMKLSEVAKYLYSVFSMSMQVFILTWYANRLIETSTGLSDAAYNSRWYDASTCFKRTIHIIMLRSSRPIHVTAMKFSMISSNTFTSIVSTSWSYFTLLRKVYTSV